MTRSPTLAEVIRAAVDAALESAHTAIPGIVTRYDYQTQSADIQPAIKLAYQDETGARVAAQLPVVPHCPVQFPGGGGFAITYPLQVGDTGLLVFSEASLDKWLSSSGAVVDPNLDHRMHLADAVFIPGVRTFGKPRQNAKGDRLVLGNDPGGTIEITPSEIRLGGAAEGVGLGDTIKAHLQALHAFVALLYATVTYSTPPFVSGLGTVVPLPGVPECASGVVKTV